MCLIISLIFSSLAYMFFIENNMLGFYINISIALLFLLLMTRNILKEKKCTSFISSHYDNISQEVNHYQVVGIKENIINMKEIEHISKYMDYSILKTNSKKTPKQAITIANILLEDSDLLNQLEILIRSEKNES